MVTRLVTSCKGWGMAWVAASATYCVKPDQIGKWTSNKNLLTFGPADLCCKASDK